MRAAILSQFGDPETSLAVGEMAMPMPKPGQVVVKIEAAPVNPADGGFVRGFYAKKPLPTVPGLEGAGTVVAANAGPIGESLMGKRVACFAPADGPGPWAEYMACDASACFPLETHVTTEMGATLLVNPLTAIGLLDTRQGQQGDHPDRRRQRARTDDPSASPKHRASPSINIVRRGDAVAKLKAEGRDPRPRFVSRRLRGSAASAWRTISAQRLRVDAVAGEMSALSRGRCRMAAKCVIYGGLSGQEPRMGAGDAIINAKSIEGFWIPLFVKAVGPRKGPADWSRRCSAACPTSSAPRSSNACRSSACTTR